MKGSIETMSKHKCSKLLSCCYKFRGCDFQNRETKCITKHQKDCNLKTQPISAQNFSLKESQKNALIQEAQLDPEKFVQYLISVDNQSGSTLGHLFNHMDETISNSAKATSTCTYDNIEWPEEIKINNNIKDNEEVKLKRRCSCYLPPVYKETDNNVIHILILINSFFIQKRFYKSLDLTIRVSCFMTQ